MAAVRYRAENEGIGLVPIHIKSVALRELPVETLCAVDARVVVPYPESRPVGEGQLAVLMNIRTGQLVDHRDVVGHSDRRVTGEQTNGLTVTMRIAGKTMERTIR